MAELYPPLVEGIIPAFYGDKLIVPFLINRAVSQNQIDKMAIKILSSFDGHEIDNIIGEIDWSISQAQFTINPQSFTTGQYYKVQIAFVNKEGVIGHYSAASTIKYVGPEPKLTISSSDGSLLNEGSVNKHTYSYIGNFECSDPSETIAIYQFSVCDNKMGLFKSTGEVIHDVSNNNHDYFNFDWDLAFDKDYFIQYMVVTNSSLVLYSPVYSLRQAYSIDAEIPASIIAETDEEEGAIILTLQPHYETLASGTFRIMRSSEQNDFLDWTEIYAFKLINHNPSIFKYKDLSVEHGVTYKYAIQQYNKNGIYSNKDNCTTITANLEHMYLYDGEKQLKIKFNPKVTSFKDTMLETKTNTIGSKYPIIFKNGDVKYKEFSISGLISCQSDENQLFKNEQRFDGTSNLTHQNIAAEKDFKLEVLEWLNNGKPKLFRTPTEGNYIVRLLNNSLSPVDTVGRMIHTFTSSATEIADYSHESLQSLEILWNGKKAEVLPQIQVQQENYSSYSSITDQAIQLMVNPSSDSTFLVGTIHRDAIFPITQSITQRSWTVYEDTFAVYPLAADEIINTVKRESGSGIWYWVEELQEYEEIDFDKYTKVTSSLDPDTATISPSFSFDDVLILLGSFKSTSPSATDSKVELYYPNGLAASISLYNLPDKAYYITSPQKVSKITLTKAEGKITYLKAIAS